jgi:SAM-dependent methyltransferase
MSKYAGIADRWTESQYADPRGYLAHRAELVVALGPRLLPGDTVLDLACGDGGLDDFLPGLHYRGVDATPQMVEAARRHGRDVELGDLNDYEPPQPVAATLCFRAIYYARDRRAFFERVRSYTTKKLVFDLNPRQYRLADVRLDLEAAGFGGFELRPFLIPQSVALPSPLRRAAIAVERSGAPARLLLRARFTYLCAAFADGTNR